MFGLELNYHDTSYLRSEIQLNPKLKNKNKSKFDI